MKQCSHIKTNVLPLDREVKSDISNNYLTLNITPALKLLFESHILKLGSSKKLQNSRKIMTFLGPGLFPSIYFNELKLWKFNYMP